MRNQWPLRIGLALVVILGICLAGRYLIRWGQFTSQDLNRIEPGMTVGEVEEIIGGSGRVQVEESPGRARYTVIEWPVPGGKVIVHFSRGRVRKKMFESESDWFQ